MVLCRKVTQNHLSLQIITSQISHAAVRAIIELIAVIDMIGKILRKILYLCGYD